MEFKSIMNKSIFIVTLILTIICWINNNVIESFVTTCIIPIFLINVLLIMNSINSIIIEKTSEKRSVYKKYENDDTIDNIERDNYIKKEEIYDKINRFFELKINRIMSWFMVLILIVFFIMVIFNQNIYKVISNFKYNSISMLSCVLLIVDTVYKEKIADYIINIIYKNIEKK